MIPTLKISSLINQIKHKFLKKSKSKEKVDIIKLLKNFWLKHKPNVWISLNFNENHNDNDNVNVKVNVSYQH
jgi:hypothetical protein